jgi:hypothetical protein
VLSLLALLIAAPPLPAAPGPRAAPPPVLAGRYLLQGTARLRATGLPADERPVEALALVGPGHTPAEVLLHLRAQGHSCDLIARRGERGALLLDRGQRCRLDVDGPDARGRIDARLREGSGSLRGDELSLRLGWDLDGSLRTRLELPGAGETWTPGLAVSGSAEGDVRGRRE